MLFPCRRNAASNGLCLNAKRVFLKLGKRTSVYASPKKEVAPAFTVDEHGGQMPVE